MKKLRLIKIYLVLSLLIFATCNKDENIIHYPNATANGIDDQALYSAIEKARDNMGILSIIVYRNNDVIAEEYFGENKSETYHPIRSVTKSVTSILFGLAMDMGLINDLNATVGDYLSEYLTASDSLVANVTIKNLLTMTAGFEWEELSDYSDFNSWVQSDDHLIYALQVPLIYSPSTHFTYTTPGCQILSAIFTKETGYSLADFAKEFLYPKLEIVGERPWDQDQYGYNYGGITLNLTAQDMLKLGILIQNEGIYNGEQIISKQWVVESTTAFIDATNSTYYADQYAYLWWLGKKNDDVYYFANGYGGQFIFVFPNLNMVVVAQSEINNEYRSSNEQWSSTISIILEDIYNSAEP